MNKLKEREYQRRIEELGREFKRKNIVKNPVRNEVKYNNYEKLKEYAAKLFDNKNLFIDNFDYMGRNYEVSKWFDKSDMGEMSEEEKELFLKMVIVSDSVEMFNIGDGQIKMDFKVEDVYLDKQEV